MKKYRSLLIYAFVLILFIGSIYLVGFSTPVQPNVDFVITYSEVPNLDYITGQGNYIEFVYPTMEGFIQNQSQTSDPNSGGKEPSGSDLSERQSDGTYDISKIEDEKKSEWTQFDWTMNEVTNIEEKDAIFSYNETATYKVYSDSDLNNIAQSNSNIPGAPISIVPISDYVFAVAENIFTNNDYTRWIMHLPDDDGDDSNGSEASHWSNGDLVEPEDFGFALEQQVRITNAAASSYQILDYSNINGVNQCVESQQSLENDPNLDIAGDWFTDTCSNLVITRDEFTSMYSSDYDNALSNNVGLIYDNEDRTVEYLLEQSTPYFAGLLINSSFYPVNYDWWVSTFGNPYTNEDSESKNLFGSTESYYLSNGAYYVESFSASYQTLFKKNEYYHNIEIVQADDWIYRVSEEPATQASLFENGYSSMAKLEDAVSPELAEQAAENPLDYPYLQSSLSSPNTRWVMFNMSSNSQTGNSSYVSNANFRKSIQYAFNRTSYLNFNGQTTALPGTLFTAGSMGSAMLPVDENNDGYISSSENMTVSSDFIDWANVVEYNSTPDPSSDIVPLNPYTTSDRISSTSQSLDSLNDPSSDITRIDQQLSVDASLYYWEEFKKDFSSDPKVNNANINNPESYIEIEYVARDSQTDILLSSFNDSLWEAGIPVEIVYSPVSTAGGLFWNEFYAAENWDILSLQWNPDYRDPLAFLKLLISPDPSMQQNTSTNWTYLYGEQASLDLISGVESSEFESASGLYSFVDGKGNSTNKVNQYFGNYHPSVFLGSDPEITKFESNGEVSKDSSGNTVKITLDSDTNSAWTQILENFVNILSSPKSVPNDRDGKSDSSGQEDPHPDQTKYYKGIKSGDFWSLSNEERFVYYLIMEILVKDGAPYIVLSNETVTTFSSRLINMTTPPVGYENYTYAYDCRNAGEGMPGCDSLKTVKKRLGGDYK